MKGRPESQSAPLQINWLAPDLLLPSKNIHYLQRLPFFSSSPPPSLLSPLLLPCTLCLLCQSRYLSELSLRVCVCVYVGGDESADVVEVGWRSAVLPLRAKTEAPRRGRRRPMAGGGRARTHPPY